MSRTGEVARYREEEHVSFFFERNIVYSATGYLLLGNWSNGNYRTDHNVFWDTTTTDPDFHDLSFEDWQALGRDENSIIADPLFVDAAAFDFRLKPDSPAFKVGFKPFDVSDVGLYGESDWTQLPKEIVRKPLELPPVQHRGPQPIDDGFETTEVGEHAAMAVTSGEEPGASIRVTGETAASGSRCLKFTDAAGLKYDWQPHLIYSPHFRNGIAHLSYAVRLEKSAILINEWRDASQPYRVGPSIRINADGQLIANGEPLMSVPIGEWVRLSIVAGLGKQATGTYGLTVTAPGQSPREFPNLPVGNAAWRSLRWLGFISLAPQKTVLYLDDVKLELQQASAPSK